MTQGVCVQHNIISLVKKSLSGLLLHATPTAATTVTASPAPATVTAPAAETVLGVAFTQRTRYQHTQSILNCWKEEKREEEKSQRKKC